MLSYVRPHGGQGEADFVRNYVACIPGVYALDDAAYVVERGESRVLFSAHVDTVHHESHGVRQPVEYDDFLQAAFPGKPQPLGADDAAGCWLLLQMIDAGVPGTYVFHRGEEKGGLGSSHLANKHREFLERFDYAVAFDRRGRGDVITHQAVGRCCSNAFAQALADQLNTRGLDYAPCANGIFTDTANYVDIIPECTNLSCGYEREHSADEMLDVAHLLALRDALLTVDWAALPVKRDPAATAWKPTKTLHWPDTTAITQDELFSMTKQEMRRAAWEDYEAFVDAVWEMMYGDEEEAEITFNMEYDDERS
jgi:hypothetical protein